MEPKMRFELSEVEAKAALEWIRNQPARYGGAIGGSITFLFTTTSLGHVVRIRNNHTNEEVDVTDYSEW